MEKHPIEGLMGESMDHIKKLIDVNTIVGDPVTTPDGTTIIPVSKVAFGFGAGGSQFSAKPTGKKEDEALFGGGSGGGVSISPVAFLIVNSEQIKLLPVKSASTTTDKLIDLVPELINKFNKIANEIIDKRAEKKAAEVKEDSEIEL